MKSSDIRISIAANTKNITTELTWAAALRTTFIKEMLAASRPMNCYMPPSVTDMINIMTNCNCSNELLELRRELMRQWFSNHAEHCGVNLAPPFPHKGDCQWTIPPVILSLPPNEVYLFLLEVSGQSYGLQLQAPEC